MKLSKEKVINFQKKVSDFYKKSGRSFPWRETKNPYHILVSELMLQQTQTDRVIPKYITFIQRFPDFKTLSTATLQEVFSLWHGLGYNRRALFLKRCAEEVIIKYKGVLPNSLEELINLPAIGHYTASAILAFAFNQPSVVIETNIRTVFIYEFFHDKETIHDKEILPLIEQTQFVENPRTWYWALMDYGVMIKKKFGNVSRKSKHYAKQSKFEGSNRQIRGLILKTLLKSKYLSHTEIAQTIDKPTKRVIEALQNLENEGIIKKDLKAYSIL